MAEKYKLAHVRLERIAPFSEVDKLVNQLLSLASSHFRVYSEEPRSGQAPAHLHPTAVQGLLWSWPPHAQIRQDLVPEFFSASRDATNALTTEIMTILKSRIAEIEQFEPINRGPEGGGSIRK